MLLLWSQELGCYGDITRVWGVTGLPRAVMITMARLFIGLVYSLASSQQDVSGDRSYQSETVLDPQ